MIDNQIKEIVLQNPETSKNYQARLLIKKQDQDLTEEDLSIYLSDYELKFFNNIIPVADALSLHERTGIKDSRNTITHLKMGNCITNPLPNSMVKQTYLQGRLVAKKALAQLTGINNLKKFTIKNGIFGQPIVHNSLISNIKVSISHSSKYVSALAFYEECPMAIDIEEINLVKEESVKSQMTQHEIRGLISQIDINYGALCLWTAKEALSKILKTGLNIDFKLLEVKEIKKTSKIIEGRFSNFSQYKFITFLSNDYICSITFPEKLILTILKNC